MMPAGGTVHAEARGHASAYLYGVVEGLAEPPDIPGIQAGLPVTVVQHAG